MRNPVLFIMAALCSFFGGCTERSEDDAYLQRISAIKHGENAQDPDYSHTVAIAIKSDDHLLTYCSGVLIDTHSASVILTAAHCVQDAENFPFAKLFSDRRIVVVAGMNSTAPNLERIFTVEAVSVHPKYVAASGTHDIALIWLDRAINEALIETPAVLCDAQNWMNQSVEFVGYGRDDDDRDSFRQKTSGTVLGVCERGAGACEVDISMGSSILVPEGSAIHSIEKGGPCSGDSGGPVLIKNSSGDCVLGITSHGDVDCSLYSVTTIAAEHIDWMREKLNPEREEACSLTRFVLNSSHNPVKISVILLLWLLFLGLVSLKHRNCQ